MGWLFNPNWETKKDLIAELTRAESHRTCLAHCIKGSTLWTVWEVSIGDVVSRYIGCDIIQKKAGEIRYKGMAEADGPYYYSCPMRYLDMVPQVANQEWRDIVIRRANVKKLEIKPGVIYQLNEGFLMKYIKVIRVYDKDKFQAEDRNGRSFTIKRSYLSGATYRTWPGDA